MILAYYVSSDPKFQSLFFQSTWSWVAINVMGRYDLTMGSRNICGKQGIVTDKNSILLVTLQGSAH